MRDTRDWIAQHPALSKYNEEKLAYAIIDMISPVLASCFEKQCNEFSCSYTKENQADCSNYQKEGNTEPTSSRRRERHSSISFYCALRFFTSSVSCGRIDRASPTTPKS